MDSGGPEVGHGDVLGWQQAAGGGGHQSHGQYGECTVGEMELVLKRLGKRGT